MTISADMKQIFIDTYRLMEAEKNYNYLNYGKYPYRDRKNSVKIIADFNADAYSVNGLFTVESEYTKVYPPQIIERIERVLTNTTRVYQSFYSEDSSTGQTAPELVSESDTYRLITIRDFVEIEDTTIQVISYAFPFNCVPDDLGRLKISF